MVMQTKSLILSAALSACLAAPLGAGDRGDGRGGDWRRPGGPNITVEPYIDLSRPRQPNVDAPEFVMAEIGRCNAAGIRLFVDCLRQNHTAIMIRRLEACVQSETIPDDPQRVAACIPLAPQR
jgi:hypothetical protein